MTRPAEFPPPFQSSEFIGGFTDDADTAIKVGLLIVGAGPAGLACAIRFGQLLSENPGTASRLGDVPVAVVEKGKQPGSHLMSGALVDPRGLLELFPDLELSELPGYGEVASHATYVMTKRHAWRIPTPGLMRNHGNRVVSLSQLGRWLALQAEAVNVTILSETSANRLLVDGGSVVGIRTGDKGVGADGGMLGNFERGVDIAAGVTVLADGTQGHLSQVALDHFGLGSEPQTWELGVKEVWRVVKPLRRVIHTMGWPLRPQARFREFGGGFVYPMGEEYVSIGFVAGLDYRDPDLSIHDLLQELKQHPLVAEILEGGERVEWGAKTIPSGGFNALPTNFQVPGLMLCGDAAGMVNVPTLKGIHYAIESGRLAAESAFSSMAENIAAPGSDLASYDRAIRSSFIWNDLHRVRYVRQAFSRGFLLGGLFAGGMVLSRGLVNVGKTRNTSDEDQPLIQPGQSKSYPEADGRLAFDKLTSVFLSGNQTHEDQPNHIRMVRRVPDDLARMWVNMCPAQVYRIGERHPDGTVTLEVSPASCVQCGAITAKGGRLTPPEGGSGPEYVLT